MIETGPVRREGFLDAGTAAALLRDPDNFDPAAVLAEAAMAYGAPGSLAVRPLTLEPGEAIASLLPEEAGGGFLLDLDPAGWRSEWGGLLLFQGDHERIHGFRPVPGALTLFAATARPQISLITPQGRRRSSLFGWWR